MPTWDDDYIARVTTEAEKEIARATNFVWDRYPLAITAGTATYTLPDYVRGIIGIEWKGRPIQPLHHQEAIRDNYQFITTRGVVDAYIRSPNDFQIIRFISVPNETVSADPDNDDLDDATVLVNRVVVYFQRDADVSGDLLSVPDYIARRLIAAWVLYRAYKKEGKGQDLAASDYYRFVYESRLKMYKHLIEKYTMYKEMYVADSELMPGGKDLALRRDFVVTPVPFKARLGLNENIDNFSDEVTVDLQP